MDKVLYYASMIDSFRTILFVLIFIVIVAGFLSLLFFIASVEVEDEEARRGSGKFLVVLSVLFLTLSITVCLTPTKRQMYMITLTRDYQTEDMKKLSEKDIDELIRKVDKLDKAIEKD